MCVNFARTVYHIWQIWVGEVENASGVTSRMGFCQHFSQSSEMAIPSTKAPLFDFAGLHLRGWWDEYLPKHLILIIELETNQRMVHSSY